MKLKKSYILAIPMFLAIVLGFFFTTTEVHAEQYTGNAIWPSEYVPNVYVRKIRADGYTKYQQGQFIRRSEDNAFVYCLQPFVNIDNNNVYNVARSDYETYLNMSEEQWERISLLAYYGYGYGSHTSTKWYAITQVLIWRTAEPTSTIYFTDSLNGTRNDSLFTSEIAEIEALVANHKKAPNFNTNSITIPLGQTITLNDSNGVLSDYKIKSQSNVSASISGNTLSITATGVGDATISLSKEDTKYSTPPVLYFVEGSQNVFRLGSYDPVLKTINLKVVGGRVEITKKDRTTGEVIPQGEASLSNAKYGVYNASTNEQVATITTDNNAYAISDYLPTLGEFYLKEITPSEGYQLDNQKYYFTIDANNLLVSVNVYEDVITREYEITKVFASDKTEIMTPEVNVKFGIYDKNNNLVSELTTDSEGKIYFELPYGHYTLRQLTATDGHELIEDYNFEIKELGSTINKVFSNAEITSRIKVVKVDQDGNIITKAGIKFKIKNLDTNEYVCQTISYPTVQTICEFETDDSGMLITPYPLNSGNYQLEEIDQIIEGYLWNSEPLKFSIDEKSDIYSTEEFDAILELHFTNKEVKGIVNIDKNGEEFVVEDGTYTYKKVDLANVEIGLYASDDIYSANGKLMYQKDELVSVGYTDENGKLTFKELYLGKYYIKEILTDENHVLDDKKYELELKYKDQYTDNVSYDITLKNYYKKGELEFSKTDLVTGEEIPNTIIEIYTDNDELIGTYKTDENGKVTIKDLAIGKYYIIEKEASTGYTITEEIVYFELKENGEIVKAEMKDKPITGSLEFSKVDLSTGEPLPNTLIEIYNEKDELVFSGRTNEEGKVVIDELRYGKYYILEKEAPEGYTLNEEKMWFEIKEDGEVVKATMTDEKEVIEVPNTLANSYIDLIAGAIVLSGTGLIIISNKRKNKNK